MAYTEHGSPPSAVLFMLISYNIWRDMGVVSVSFSILYFLYNKSINVSFCLEN